MKSRMLRLCTKQALYVFYDIVIMRRLRNASTFLCLFYAVFKLSIFYILVLLYRCDKWQFQSPMPTPSTFLRRIITVGRHIVV